MSTFLLKQAALKWGEDTATTYSSLLMRTSFMCSVCFTCSEVLPQKAFNALAVVQNREGNVQSVQFLKGLLFS